MILLPAIDLVGGRCVRLMQGDFARETVYPDDPAAALTAFSAGGAGEVHLVDLDGAKAGQPIQHDLFVDLAAETSLAMQVAGGFRTNDQVERMLDAGVARVVIGSLAIDDADAFAGMLEQFGEERLTLALDVIVKDDATFVATHGWATGSGVPLETVLQRFPSIRHVLVTDIGKDGMLQGPNVRLMKRLVASFPQIALQASGGVADLDDLDGLRDTGAVRAIVGKAIWERRFSVAEGVRRARG